MSSRVNCFVLSVYVTTVTSPAAAPVRSAVLYPSQCQVSAELVPDVKTVANRTDSVLTFPRSLNMRHEKSVKSKALRVVVPPACDDSSGERQSSGEARRSSPCELEEVRMSAWGYPRKAL